MEAFFSVGSGSGGHVEGVNMEITVEQQMADIATKAAKQYANLCWWVDPRDLEQEAWTILLDFRTRWAPRTESGEIDRQYFGNYGYRAVMRQMSRYLWRQRSPVKLSDHDCCQAVAETAYHAPVLETFLDATPAPDKQLATARSQRVIRRRMLALCGGVMSPWVKASLEVILEEKPVRAVAAERGLPSRELARRVSWARNRLCSDSVLRQMLVGGG